MVKYGDKLTRRERAVVRALLAGHTSNELLSIELGISARTVGAFLRTIFKKTGARDRTHLILLLSDGDQMQPLSYAGQSVTAIAHALWKELDQAATKRLIDLLISRL